METGWLEEYSCFFLANNELLLLFVIIIVRFLAELTSESSYIIRCLDISFSCTMYSNFFWCAIYSCISSHFEASSGVGSFCITCQFILGFTFDQTAALCYVETRLKTTVVLHS